MRIPSNGIFPTEKPLGLSPSLSLSFAVISCSPSLPPSLPTTNPPEPHVSVTFLPLGLPAFPPARFFGHPHSLRARGRDGTEREKSASGCESHGWYCRRRRPHWHRRVACRARAHSLPSPICSLARSPAPLWKCESAYFFTLLFLPHSIPFSHAEDSRRSGRLSEQVVSVSAG